MHAISPACGSNIPAVPEEGKAVTDDEGRDRECAR